HCYQIANHMKDIYADDITLSVGAGEKLVPFLESEIAGALADRPGPTPASGWTRLTPAADPDITAINAAFALALLERHDLVGEGHRIYDLAGVAARDAPGVDMARFRRRFRDLEEDLGPSGYRRELVASVRDYATGRADPAAD
ncbi:MAG: DUF5781 family protein, partial [Halobacteriales archaeon]